MKIPEKRLTLKDGRICTLKSPGPEDAAQMLACLRVTSEETPFMVRYPEEIDMTAEQEAAFLLSRVKSETAVLIAAQADGKIIGSAGIEPIASRIRLCHRAMFGIAVCREYWNAGLGTALLRQAIICAKELGYEQVELEAVTENTRAVSLYLKNGFVVYGTREHSMRYKDGSYAAEYLMLCQLDEREPRK